MRFTYKGKVIKMSTGTEDRKLALMKHAFTLTTREWELARDNPVKRVSLERENTARDRWLTEEEADRLIEASVIHATGKDNVLVPHYWLQKIIIFNLNTGMWQDEILSLEWPHVDLFRKTVTIMKSKNGEKRTIPLNKRAFELLKLKARESQTTSGYVFASEVVTKILARNVHRGFDGAKKRAEINDFRFHDLRHTFATLWPRPV